MSRYFPEPKSSGTNVKSEFDLSNCATKTDVKNTTGIETLSLAKKADLADLKSNVEEFDRDELKNVPTNLISLKIKKDKVDVDQLVSAPIDLSKLSDVVKNDFVKKDEYNGKIKTIEDKIAAITKLATNASPNGKKMRLKIKYLVLLT